MKKTTTALAAAILTGLLAAPAASHSRDVMTVGGRVGPIRTGETTVGEMRELFGKPRDRNVRRIGCSRVVRLKWGKMRTFHYPGQNRIVDVRVRAPRVPSENGAYRFHTRRGLRVGDSERRVNGLYPNREGRTHAGHTHYVLGERGTRLLAKVVDGRVVELESAPYEFC